MPTAIEGYCLTCQEHYFGGTPRPTRPPSRLLPAGARNAVLVDDATWPKRSALHIAFQGGPLSLREEVESYIREWELYTSLDFRWDIPADGPAQVRISLTGAPGQFWSYIGAQAERVGANSPTMHLGLESVEDPKERRRLVLHEMGHTLGLIHEHQTENVPFEFTRKPDGDLKIYDYFAKHFGWSRSMVDRNILEVYSEGVSNSEFDNESIMLYWFPPGTVKPPRYSNKVNDDLSDNDREFVSAIYEADPFDRMRGFALFDGQEPVQAAVGRPGDSLVYKFKAERDGPHTFEVTESDLPVALLLFNYENLNEPLNGDRLKRRNGLAAWIEARDLKRDGNYYLVVQNRAPAGFGCVAVEARHGTRSEYVGRQ